MKRLLVFTSILGTFALPLAASAQDALPEPPRVDPSRVKRASEVSRGDFSDPGNVQATLFAKERGISVGQATSQLKRQAALNRFIERLKERHPDKFSYVSVEGDRILVGLTDPSVDLQSMLPPGLANVTAVQAVYSEQGMYAELDDLTRQLKAAGLSGVTVGVNSATGKTTTAGATSSRFAGPSPPPTAAASACSSIRRRPRSTPSATGQRSPARSSSFRAS